MKMAASVLRLRSLCSSSSSSPILIRNLLCRSFSAPSPSRLSKKISPESEQDISMASKLGGGEAISDEDLMMNKVKRWKNWELFKSWMSEHKRRYRSNKVILRRFKIFNKTVQSIKRLNKKYLGRTTFGLNQFSDLTLDEIPRGLIPRPLPSRVRRCKS